MKKRSAIWTQARAVCPSLATTLAWLMILAWTGIVRAQTVPVKETPDSAYTMHVYTDLLQVPAIVLTKLHDNYRSLTTQSFTLSLEGGPRFHPTSVRLEGDDPIMLAILFDLTTDNASMFTSFAHAMSTLPPEALSARDHISVYAYDCQLVRATVDKPATPAQLQASMAKVLSEGRKQARNGEQQSCLPGKRLYDAVARVSQDIGELSGRRVVLVISDGEDRRSVNDWSTVARFAGSKSISIFGIRPPYKPTTAIVFGHSGPIVENSDPFGMLCESSGGLVLDSKNSNRMMSKQIQRVVTILRDRYILEFPRPANGSAGFYSIDVKIDDPTAIIRPAGVAFPPRPRDPKQPDGTVPKDPSQMPLIGSKNAESQPE